jgi:O-antigen/teichoic acid export membrane protein
LILEIFSGAVSTSSLPEISYHHSQENFDRVEEILTDAIIFSSILVIPAFVGMLVIAEPLIVTFYTGAFSGAAIIATIAVAIQIPASFKSIFSTALNAVDRPDLTFKSGMVLIGVNVVLDLVLVPTIGVVGAVIASLTAFILETLYLFTKLLQELDVDKSIFPFRPVLSEVFSAIVMGAIISITKEQLNLSVIPLLIVLVCLGVVIYFATLLLISSAIRDRVTGIAHEFI